MPETFSLSQQIDRFEYGRFTGTVISRNDIQASDGLEFNILDNA